MDWGIILNLLLQGVLMFLRAKNASENTINKFIALVEAAKNDGMVTVKIQDNFKSQSDKLLERRKQNKEGL
jgi:hypothetical protein